MVRQQIFPEHRISYTGKVAFRRLIPEAEVAHISGIPRSSCFWHGPTTHVYTNYLPGGLFEIATRAVEGPEYGEKVSWGRKIDTARVVPHYEAFNETIRQIIAVPEDYLEFAMYGGPLLRRVIANGNIAVLGDASHPLSGAFGSGAAFAFEDAFVLSRALDRAQRQGQSIADALEVYDAIRAPRYQDLFKVLDTMAANAKHVASEIPASEPNARIEAATQLNWQLENGWIYAYNVSDTSILPLRLTKLDRSCMVRVRAQDGSTGRGLADVTSRGETDSRTCCRYSGLCMRGTPSGLKSVDTDAGAGWAQVDEHDGPLGCALAAESARQDPTKTLAAHLICAR